MLIYYMAYDIAVILGLAAIAFIFAFISTNVEKKHSVLQFLFLFLSLGTILLIFAAMVDITARGDYTVLAELLSTGYTATVWVIVFFILYTIVYFLINVSKSLARSP
jgi:hypothetical protein